MKNYEKLWKWWKKRRIWQKMWLMYKFLQICEWVVEISKKRKILLVMACRPATALRSTVLFFASCFCSTNKKRTALKIRTCKKDFSFVFDMTNRERSKWDNGPSRSRSQSHLVIRPLTLATKMSPLKKSDRARHWNSTWLSWDVFFIIFSFSPWSFLFQNKLSRSTDWKGRKNESIIKYKKISWINQKIGTKKENF